MIVSGDILSIEHGVIIHLVNNCGLMGRGIAKDIRELYPSHYNDYMRIYNSMATQYGVAASTYYNKPAIRELLGNIVYTRISDTKAVIGLFAQHGLGKTDRGQTYIQYHALEYCLNQINLLYAENANVRYYIPEGVGSGNAGGNKQIIHSYLNKVSPYIIMIKKGE